MSYEEEDTCSGACRPISVPVAILLPPVTPALRFDGIKVRPSPGKLLGTNWGMPCIMTVRGLALLPPTDGKNFFSYISMLMHQAHRNLQALQSPLLLLLLLLRRRRRRLQGYRKLLCTPLHFDQDAPPPGMRVRHSTTAVRTSQHVCVGFGSMRDHSVTLAILPRTRATVSHL
jgi:hypothetical protein